jgi:hypothetical protein
MANSGRLFGIFLLAVILTAGCTSMGSNSSSDEVRAFFVTAQEANYLGVLCMSPRQMDLSSYSHLMGIKYPPTHSVEVLNSPPSRPYQAFAVLESPVPYASETYDPALLEDFKNKARAIGADAIILFPPKVEILPRRQNSAKMEAVAVKYRLENPMDSKCP